MGSACEGDDIRAAALRCHLLPVVPAHPSRRHTQRLDKRQYRQCDEGQQVFRRINAYRRFFTRYERWDVGYIAFTSAPILEYLGNANTP